MPEQPTPERTVVVHTCFDSMEAMVIRGLLESNGIVSPTPPGFETFPMEGATTAARAIQILVLESKAAQARHLIQDYLDDSEIQPADEDMGGESGD
jgi:hypothetical protein